MEVWIVFLRWMKDEDEYSHEILSLFHVCRSFRKTLEYLRFDVEKVRTVTGIDMYLQGSFSSEYWLPSVRVIESGDTPTLIEIDSTRYLRWSIHHHILLELL
jgi:hypothetical protein